MNSQLAKMSFKFCRTLVKVVVVLAVVETVAPAPIFGVPLWVAKFKQRSIDQINQCAQNEAVNGFCEECGRTTQNTWAYPLCCMNRSNMRQFCYNYITYDLDDAKSLPTDALEARERSARKLEAEDADDDTNQRA